MKKRIPMQMVSEQPSGKEYWRSLEQLARSEEYQQFLHREFPEGASEMGNDWSRRSFLTLMGASIALAGLAGCRRPVEKIVPYVNRPEEVIPGRPMYFATNMPFGTDAYGLLAKSSDGRPTKLEGNPDHPSTLGSSNAYIQAEILNLYDPDRLQRPVEKGVEKEWSDFVDYWRQLHTKYVENRGEGLAVLSESFASPTLYRLKQEFERTFPKARWVTWESLPDRGREFAGANAEYKFDNADVILSLDCDFLGRDGNTVLNARGFAERRHVESKDDDMSRLWVAESAFTITGTMADHRYRIQSSRVCYLAEAVAEEVGRLKFGNPVSGNTDGRPEFDRKWIETVAKDLVRAGSKALVVAGEHQSPAVHALADQMNMTLGTYLSTLSFREAQDSTISDLSTLSQLLNSVGSDQVETLIVFGGNPVYSSPADLNLVSALKKVKDTIHFTDRLNETSQHSIWSIPRSHFLESWGDTRSNEGTRGVTQPLIEPLFQSRSDAEFLSLLVTGSESSGYETVRETWKDALRGGDFEKQWRQVLHDGVLGGKGGEFGGILIDYETMPTCEPYSEQPDTLEINFRPSAVYDGRYSNNGWLQELPDPVHKIAWDNPALISPATAKKYNLESGDMIRIELNGRSIDIPTWVSPGHADDSITLHLGYGRTHAGRIGNGVGFNVNPIRTSEYPYIAQGAKIMKLDRKYPLANTQHHGSMEGRPIVRESTLAQYKASDHPTFTPEPPHHPPLNSLWDEHQYNEGYQWGMTVDLNKCIGCNACTVACQSENNIPIVGKQQVINGREMHWIRLDRYYAGDPEDPETVFQPVACQHCEMAPCETVCPVAATVHDHEGLNVMVYNRCVGTRYCSNNCPYKVRRFNFFSYTTEYPEVHKMAQNPDVTVRSRGVMEKCTYCLQRINAAKIAAKADGREVADGDLQTACQQVCPSKAITFGNIRNPESEVAKTKKINRNYDMLVELNTRPRTSYLARLRNPHPDLADEVAGESTSHTETDGSHH